jgi:hypothetical protein
MTEPSCDADSEASTRYLDRQRRNFQKKQAACLSKEKQRYALFEFESSPQSI